LKGGTWKSISQQGGGGKEKGKGREGKNSSYISKKAFNNGGGVIHSEKKNFVANANKKIIKLKYLPPNPRKKAHIREKGRTKGPQRGGGGA